MHGQNVVRHKEENPNALQVAEIFHTLQGEGPFSGTPAIFIRLTGCNLRCWFCDTTWNDETDPVMDVKSICMAVMLASPKSPSPEVELIVITGGEPMRQELSELIPRLQGMGHMVQIETSGSIYQPACDNAFVVLSPKTPKVAPEFRTRVKNICWKYVMRQGEVDEQDGLPIVSPQPGGGGALARPPLNLGKSDIFLQPCDEGNELAQRANTIAVRDSCLVHGYTASVQLHKILGVA